MSASFVASQLRRTTITLLVTNVILLAGALGVAVATSDAIAEVMRGPWAIDRQTLLAVVDPSAVRRSYVHVLGRNVAEVGDYGEGQGDSRRVKAKFVALDVSDRLLVVKATPDEASGGRFTGFLVPMPDDMRAELLNMWRAQKGEEKGEFPFLPVMLDAAGGTGAIWFWLAVGALVVAVSTLKIVQGIRRLGDPSRHPSWAALARYGAPRANADAIDTEIARGDQVLAAGKTRLTPTWLVHRSAFAVHMVPLAEIVWYFKHVTKHYTNFIPSGKTFALHVHDQQGRVLELEAKETEVDRLLAELPGRAPWAIGGWSPELAAAMGGPQRAEVAREVEARRRAARAA